MDGPPPAKEVIESIDQHLGTLLGAHLGEADDVCEEDADVVHLGHEEVSEATFFHACLLPVGLHHSGSQGGRNY